MHESSRNIKSRIKNIKSRIDALHDKSLIILCHDHMVRPEDFEDMKQGGVTAKIIHLTVDVAVFDEPEEYQKSLDSDDGWVKRALLAIDNVMTQIENSKGAMKVIRTAGDIIEAKNTGRTGIIMGFEGGKPLEGSIEVLRDFWRIGVRHLQFTWAYDNQLSSAQCNTSNTGLTEFGRMVVKEMNRLGMLIDISHLNARAISDVLTLSSKPVVFSHGGAQYFTSTKGYVCNLTDEQIKSLADKGGVFGVHFCSHILNEKYYQVKQQASMDDLLNQIDHIVKVGGIDLVGLGPDYMPMTENYLKNTKQEWITFVEGLENVGKLKNLTEALVKRGYSDDSIEKILGGNLLRIFSEVFV